MKRIAIGELAVDRLTMDQAVDRIIELVHAKKGGYVVTPNVDHVVLAEQHRAFRSAYADASLSLADGMPVVWASRLLREPLPEKISGSDLVEPLLARAAREELRLFVFGGGGDASARAGDAIARRFPTIQVVGTAAPRVREDAHREELLEAMAPVRAASPDVVFVCLGAPKQEILMHAVHRELAPAVLLGLGAAVDFIAGTARRAPRWMSQNGLEWAYRLASEPGRLWRRYLLRDPQFAWIVAREALRRAR